MSLARSTDSRFTRRGWLVLSIVCASLLAGFLGVEQLVFVSLPAWWMLALSARSTWWATPSVMRTSISQRNAVAGDEIELEIALHSEVRLPWLELSLDLPNGLGATERTQRVLDFPASEDGSLITRSVQLSFQVERWGLQSPRSLVVRSCDRYELVEHSRSIPLVGAGSGCEVAVHPGVTQLDELLELGRTDITTGEHRSRRYGRGTEFAEVRPARIGDGASLLHPRLSARRGEPMLVERHPDQSSDVVLLIDSSEDVGTLASDIDTTLRWCVRVAMAVQARHLRAMDRVGIIDRGSSVRWLAPGLGRRAAHQIVRTLLSLQAGQRQSSAWQAGEREAVEDGGLPLGRLPNRCIVLAFSPGLSDVFNRDLVRIRRRGHEVIVVQPRLAEHHRNARDATAARIGRVLLESRRRWLQEHGVLVLDWEPAAPIESLVATLNRVRNRRTAAGGRS